MYDRLVCELGSSSTSSHTGQQGSWGDNAREGLILRDEDEELELLALSASDFAVT